MPWILIAAGLLVLLAVGLLTYLLRRSASTGAQDTSPVPMHYARLRSVRQTSRLLRRFTRVKVVGKDVEALQLSALTLTKHLLRLSRELRRFPLLPANQDGEPRLMELARDVADGEDFTPQSLLDALSAWNETHPSPQEIAALPAYVAAAQCQRLSAVLRAMLTDVCERIAAARLAKRLQRRKHPDAILNANRLNSIGLAALLFELRKENQSQLLALLDAWLDHHEISAEALTISNMKRQVHLADEIRRALDCFSALEKMNWLRHCSAADELHTLLLQEPSGVYARMDDSSQMQLRLQISELSRRCRIGAMALVQQAFILCGEAEERSLEQYAGYWFQDADGLTALHRALPTRRGWLYAHLTLRREKLAYAALWGFAIITGFLFLHGRQPVFMLPFFALTVGCISRRLLHFSPSDLPAMKLSASDTDMHTLVVLHAELRDPHDAIQAVRRLKTARHAFSGEHIDFLLLGDFAPGITAVSSGDLPIIQAASAALAALDAGDRVMYLQRGRTWDSAAHRYCARAGLRGAMSAMCRLIAQGECEDVIAYSTAEAASFERKYAYVLSLPVGCLPAHGLLERLLQSMAHPLCQHYPTPKGVRGHAMLLPEECSAFEGVALIRPDAFLETTDGRLPQHASFNALCGELAGQAPMKGAHVQSAPQPHSWDDQYTQAVRAWELLPWQLPWVQTPSGMISNPLKQGARFRLREHLRRTLIPLGQFGLLLWAVLTQNWLLLLLALIAPEIGNPMRRPVDFFKFLCRTSLLPTRASVSAAAAIQLLRKKSDRTPEWVNLEAWVQGLTATLWAALGFVLPGFAVPAFILSILFAGFPLAHRFLDTPILPDDPLTNEHIALLDSAASATWQFFSTHVTKENHFLPPCTVQSEPSLGMENMTSPEAIGSYLLACVCAKDLDILSADEAAARIRQTLESIGDLSMPFGLPCRRYALPSLTVQDAQVEAGSTGFLLAALMTTAQALRTWLPELSQEYAGISAEAARLANAFDLSRLYDEDAMLFHAVLDVNGQGVGYVEAFADEALLLSIAACAKGDVPPEHLHRLERTCISLRDGDVPLSRHGTAAEHLLSGLFVPLDEQDAVHFIRAMASRGQDGLFGQDACRYFAFDPELRYRHGVFGLADASATFTASAAVYAPHAAALCLPFAPKLAADALVRFRDLGALGPVGFCDTIDLNQGTALVGLRDAFHQGIILAAASHILADSPLRRYFSGLPEVEACLPLLAKRQPPMVLPALPIHPADKSVTTDAERTATPLTFPTDARLLGTADFHLLADANGCSAMYDGTVPLTRIASAQGKMQGIQFYLADEGRIYRLGSAMLPGTITFAPGEARYEQVCGSLKTELVCTADTVRRRALHTITITNLSTRDRLVELADCLLPDLHADSSTLEADRPEKQRLTLHVRGTDVTLHHTFAASSTPLTISACTDAAAFLGRSGSLHQPASLEEPDEDYVASTAAPCLSFRIRLTIGGRGQTRVWFATSLNDAPAPQLWEINGIRSLAALQHGAIQEAAALTDEQALTASRLVAPVLAANAKLALELNADDASDVLDDLLAITNWFRLHGMPLDLCIVCSSESAANVTDALRHPMAEGQLRVVAPAEFDPAEYKLLLRSDAPLTDQAEALYRIVTPPPVAKPPIPALLPEKELLHSGMYGGFDPETSDFIIQLEPGQTTPGPWQNRHISRYFTETVDEGGFRAPFYEQVYLRTEDGTLLSPWSKELPRSIRIGTGQTDWESWSDKLDIRLCAAALPGHRCGLRVLRIRNATDAPMVLRLSILARFDANAPLDRAPGIILNNSTAQRFHAFIAGEDWEARRTNALETWSVTGSPCLDLPDNEQGSTALLSREINLPPHASGKAVWLSGYARHGEDIARALSEVQTEGTSTLLRSVRAAWSQRLGTLTFDTPEDTLTLLMNRILPMQSLCAEGIGGVPALIHLLPQEAKRSLLRTARKASSREEWARLALMIKAYILVTEDESVLDVRLPLHDAALYSCCSEALISLLLDSHGLPLGKDQAKQCFVYAMAAQALDALRPDVTLQELHRKLLNAADTYLWQDGYYGNDLVLDVQHLACRTYGSNVRTRQAVQTCWRTLYDQPHGLIRQQAPTDAAVLPGLPQNGGMITLNAVCFLHALLQTEHIDEAFELLRALNPLHHTDDPVRMETFRCAPYLLHGGMCASPMEAGRAFPEGGHEAAALLFAVVLHDILGFRRTGSVIRIEPCVPPDWEDYTITLREGASTWRISVERRIKVLTIDGDEVEGNHFSIHDDGKIHRVRFPLA